jgi:hypothetical protein
MKKHPVPAKTGNATELDSLAHWLVLEGVFGGDASLWRDYLESEATARQRQEDGAWVDQMMRRMECSVSLAGLVRAAHSVRSSRGQPLP